MIRGLKEIDLSDSEWGDIHLLVALPVPEEPWGTLACLRQTAWGDQIQVVSGEVLSHALHGWATPLMRSLGVTPDVRSRRIPEGPGRCRLFKGCIAAKSTCRPGKGLPACYEAPSLDQKATLIASTVALAWSLNRYVVVVTGKEFSL